MARIFSLLAAVAALLIAANFVVGLCGGDFNTAANQKRAAQARLIGLERQMRAARIRTSPELEQAKAALAAADAAFQGPRWWMTLHMLLGTAASLLAVLVNCVTMTYFIGTSRWCKEVCETYNIRPELAQRSAQLKRSAFPWALAGILAIIITVGLGAAADPSGANYARSASLVMPHFLAATIGLVIVLAAFWVQIGRIAENSTVIEEILDEVRRIRAAKNLPTEEASAP